MIIALYIKTINVQNSLRLVEPAHFKVKLHVKPPLFQKELQIKYSLSAWIATPCWGTCISDALVTIAWTNM